ncbi:P-loop NTPase family protein [Helicobacter cetorum]|uniref:CobQ/CobB/MinD/ParA nucleotide binding domain-containing protein n=1 Tax=Helicobacter cetorum (strain ATCC BAA-540 / CCUG 52418 / MIT 99-5656) TaxID=1163745 RepID=I0EUV1_HELCM|nr:hypothetical protein [Helicobacter cetorum]AFI06720.1 hypothetical protein HCD_08789 [Helicobacter cetorum MIT 99-5656]
MIAVVLNSKGGVGKSTFANQILTSYFYEKSNGNFKVKLVEIDDENNDVKSLYKSNIIDEHVINTNKLRQLDDFLITDENLIIDVGGNKTTEIFLKEIQNYFHNNFVWFIPLGNGEQDNLNAYDTYKKILEVNSRAKIIFVLSRVKDLDDLTYEFMNFFGNKYFEISGIFDLIQDVSYITIKDFTILTHSRFFNKTAYDLGTSEKNSAYYTKKISENFNDREQAMKFQKFKRLAHSAENFVSYLRDDVFKQLDSKNDVGV